MEGDEKGDEEGERGGERVGERESGDPDLEDYYKGLLLAFTVGISSQSHHRPHCDDLPPEPSNWYKIIKHPYRDVFIEAASLEVKTLDKKGTYQEIDRPIDRSV